MDAIFNGDNIWRFIVELRDAIIGLCSSAYNIFTMELIAILDALFGYLPSGNVIVGAIKDGITALITAFGNPTVLDLMFGMFIVYVAVVVIKWFVGLFK